MDEDPISSSSEEESPPTPAPGAYTPSPSATISVKLRIPPRKKHVTRQGSLSTSKTKKELLATPHFDTSMKTKEQARKLLVERELLTPDQDPGPSSLSTVLLHLESTVSGLTAPGAEAIRTVTIILDSLVTPSSNSNHVSEDSPSSNPNKLDIRRRPTISITTDLSDQIAEIKTTIQELHKAAATNETSANMLLNTVDETRDELHCAAQVVTSLTDKLTDSLDRPVTPSTPLPTMPSPPNTEQQSIVSALQEIKTLIRERPSAPSYSYKDALTKANSSHQMSPPLPSLQEQARANAAVKERQILIDLAEDHPVKRQVYSTDEMLTFFQTALDAIKEKDDLDVKIRSLKLLKNGGILLELLNKEAAEWLKLEAQRNKFATATGGKLNIKDRLFNIVVQFIPISTALEDNDILRYIEEDSKIPRNSIISARWIKPISKRSPFQRFAHAIFSISSPVIANHIIKQGLIINRENLRAYKDKKEPLRCLKCQKWGHVARTCKADKDTCGSCAENHRSSACP